MIIEQIKDNIDKIVSITISDRKDKCNDYTKIAFRPIIVKGKRLFQMVKSQTKKVFHSNISVDELLSIVENEIPKYKQLCLKTTDKIFNYTLVGKQRVRISDNNEQISYSHDKEKSYLLCEGMNIPAMVDLGVFNSEYKIIKAMHNKYKQINRFIEIIDDKVSKINQKHITILDFGCGKSYLTFILYYYLTEIRHFDLDIVGYDLKSDVVAECNEIAHRYGYDKLRFEVNDVKNEDLYDKKVDIIVSLHACDVATDYALAFAIKHNIPYIFSVPCCQHEVNMSINKGGDFDILLKHGLIKERFSALFTDAIRAEILEKCGYQVEIIEFVDFAHSPKNLMIRAYKKSFNKTPDLNSIRELTIKYNVQQTLLDILDKKTKKL